MSPHRIVVACFAFVPLALVACGDDSDGGDATVDVVDVSEVRDTTDGDVAEETVEEVIADTGPRETREDVADGNENPDNLLVDYQYGNQVTGSTLTIDALGVTTRSERICCPPTTTPTDTADLSFSQIAGLRADIEAIAAADALTSKELGTFADGASVGSLTVFRNGYAYVVKAYENQGDRVRIESTANDARTRILALVNSIVDVDLLD